MSKRFLILIIIIATIFSVNSFAYLDPGTGGVIIGSLWPLILTILTAIGAFFVKWFWKPIKNTFLKLTGSSKKENKKQE